VNERGEDTGEQYQDSMNMNHLKRHRIPDKLKGDSKVQNGSMKSFVEEARVSGKLPYLIRAGLAM
jgi:hypothetical protein